MRALRPIRAMTAVFLVFVVSTSVAAAQTTPLVEDELTEPSAAFDEQSGGDVAVIEFGAGGMTVAAVNKGKALYLHPASLPDTDALLNASIEVTVTAGSKKTGVGVFCRRSDANGGYLVVITGKKYGVYGRDDFNDLTKLDGGKSQHLEAGAANTIRLDCERESATGFSMILTLTINGEEVLSRLEPGAPNLGSMGLYLEGLDGKRALATFRDLVVEELPAP